MKDCKSEVEDHQTTGHTGWEHYRFGAFIRWIKSRNSASEAQINCFLELSLTDDPLMGQSAAIELLKAAWITDGQFELAARALQTEGEWALQKIQRWRLIRSLHQSKDMQTQMRCFESMDLAVHETLLNLANLDSEVLSQLCAKGATNRIRNIAKDKIKQNKKSKK